MPQNQQSVQTCSCTQMVERGLESVLSLSPSLHGPRCGDRTDTGIFLCATDHVQPWSSPSAPSRARASQRARAVPHPPARGQKEGVPSPAACHSPPARRRHPPGYKHSEGSRKQSVQTGARNWQLRWHFGSKVWLRKEAKRNPSVPKYCQLKPLRLSSRTVPWVFYICVTRKNTKDVTCSVETLANCSSSQAKKGNYRGTIACSNSDLEKNCLSFPAVQSQRLFNPQICLHSPSSTSVSEEQPSPDGNNLQAGEGTYITSMTIQSSGRCYFLLELIYR